MMPMSMDGRPPTTERPATASLRDVVACTWRRTADGLGFRVVPDGCVDLIWGVAEGLIVAGADREARVVDLPAGTVATGIRLHPWAAGAVLGVPAREVQGLLIPAADVMGPAASRVESSLVRGSPVEREALLGGLVACRARADPVVRAVVLRLEHADVRVAALARDLGVSERQLRRRTLTAIGLAPKALARVVRLKRLARLDGPLARRALDAGYASQAHMCDEVRRLTGVPAGRFLEDTSADAA